MRESAQVSLIADVVVLGTARERIDKGAVVVRSGRIAAVGPRAQLMAMILQGEVLDFGEATILPGLIDGHAHVTWPADGSNFDQIGTMGPDTAATVAISNLQKHLASGVTTVRDNGSKDFVSLRVKKQVAGQIASFPRMYVAGPPITQSDGHMNWCGATANTPEELRSRVRSLASRGVDHIKLVGSGGGTVGTYQYEASYPARHLAVAVNEAHSHGLRTTIHCHAAESIRRAAEAQVDCIEHASFIVPNPGADIRQYDAAWTGLRAAFDPEIASAIAESNCYISLTLLGGYLPLLALRHKRDQDQLSDFDALALAATEEHLERKLSIGAALRNFGLGDRLLISTDAGPGNTPFGAMHLAAALGVAMDMVPIEAIESVTRVAAEALGVDDSVGRIGPGMDADLLVVSGDATSDISALGAVRMVMRSGRVVPGHESFTDQVQP